MPDRPNSAQLKSAFSAWAFVSTYGVDAESGGPRAGFADRIGLTVEKFFETLYEPRPQDEEFILNFVRSNAMSMWLIGSVGVGKSTIAYRVLRQYNDECSLPNIIIDFQTHDVHLHNHHALDHWIRDQIAKKVGDYISSEGLMYEDLALVFFRDDCYRMLSAGRNATLHKMLMQKYLEARRYDGVSVPVVEWLHSHCEPGAERSSEIRRLLARLGAHLSVIEQLFAVAEIAKPISEPRQRIVVLFDNIDSIGDINVRDGIKQWLVTEAETFKAAAVFLMCVRPENEEAFLPDDKDSIIDTREESHVNLDDALFSEGATVVMQLSLDPPMLEAEAMQDLIDAERERWRAGDDSMRVQPSQVNSELARRLAFDDCVHNRRVAFLESLAIGRSIPGIDAAEIRAVAAACSEVRSIAAINRDAQMLANGNRREMLAAIAEFVDFVIHKLKLDWRKIGGINEGDESGERRRTALKSLYYKWMAHGARRGSSITVYDTKLFDPVSWIANSGWHREGKLWVLEDELIGATPKYLLSLIDLYIYAALYNASGNSMIERWRGSVQVRRVVDMCERLRLDGSIVLERLNWIIRQSPVRHGGMLETSRYQAVRRSAQGLIMEDKVSLLDRACQLLESTGLMFNYVAELVAARSGRGFGDARHYEHGVVPVGDIPEVISWIRRGITTELRIVEHLKGDGRVASTVWDEYVTNFCIKLSHDKPTGRPALHWHRIVRLGAAYLRKSSQCYIDDSERTAVDGYADELELLDEYIDQYIVPNVCAGNWYLIPRNEPIAVPRHWRGAK